MTLKLELTEEQEIRLRERARAEGVEPEEFLMRVIDVVTPSTKGLRPGESVLDALKRVGYVGSFKGVKRADGKAWSEIEGFE